MLKRLLIVLACVLASLPAAVAQLASLEPRSMESLDTPSNGNPMLAYVEVVFSEPVLGAKVSADNFAATDKTREATPTTIYARVVADSPASRGAYGKSMTVVHPDYLPCVLDFEALGFRETLKPGRSYRIRVDVPEAALVRAHRAFADLDYPLARKYYRQYLEGGGEYATLASQRLAMMDKMKAHLDFLNNNAASSDRNTRIRMMKCAKDIYDLTSSMEAYRRYQNLRSQLVKRSAAAFGDGASTLKIDSIWHDERDMRAKSDTSLPLVNGNAYYSWIIVNLGLDDAWFETEGLFDDPEKIDGGNYRLKVAPGAEGPKNIVVHHPDCSPLDIHLSQFGINEIKPASVYTIEIQAPPAALIEADRAFSNLDFHSAQALYSDILQNSGQFSPEILSMVSSRLYDVNSLIDRDFRAAWRRLRDFFVKRPTASREELASRADSLARMAGELQSLHVPGMENNARHYAERAREYRNSVYLDFSVTEMNNRKEILVGPDGNPKPLDAKSLLVEFVLPGAPAAYPVKASYLGPGHFGVYLPKKISEHLTSRPDASVEVILRDPASRKKYDIQAGKRNKLIFSLDSSSDRTIATNIYAKAINTK